MRAPVRVGLLALCCAVLVGSARADEVVLKSGGAIRGRVVSESEQEVVIQTDAGPVTIARARIASVTRSAPQPPPRAPAPATEAPAPATEAPPAATARTLLLFGFDGADRRLLTAVAERVRATLGVEVQVLGAHPAPDERDLIDVRPRLLPEYARALQLQLTGSVDDAERQIRAALARDPRPDARRAEAVVDDACRPRLSVARLDAQAASVAGERLKADGVIGVIGVTHRDVASPEVNFLFGHGDRAAHAGVVSYLRFGGADVRREVLAQRLAVQVLSTTGVLLGLGACLEPSCARAYPKNLEEHDRKRDFCAACRAKVDAALRR